MLKDLERATFSNIEEQGLNFLRHTMWPWLVRITSEIDFKLLTPLNGPAFHAWFNTDPLTQGDRKSRMEAHSLAAQAGIMTRNEIRRLEGLPDLPGLDVPLTPVNTVGGVPAPVDPGDSDPSETD
jgi:HK97 family phage portal protein